MLAEGWNGITSGFNSVDKVWSPKNRPSYKSAGWCGRRYSKSIMGIYILSAAAIVLIGIFVRFAPFIHHPTDKWSIMQCLFSGAKTTLTEASVCWMNPHPGEGVLEIAMDQAAPFCLSPAEVRLENDNQVFWSGKVNPKVPPRPLDLPYEHLRPPLWITARNLVFRRSVRQTVAQVLKDKLNCGWGRISLCLRNRWAVGRQAGVFGGRVNPAQTAVQTFTYEMPSPFEFYAKSLNRFYIFASKTILWFLWGCHANTGLTIETGVPPAFRKVRNWGQQTEPSTRFSDQEMACRSEYWTDSPAPKGTTPSASGSFDK